MSGPGRGGARSWVVAALLIGLTVGPAEARKPRPAPEGFVAMEVVTVAPTPRGDMVLLADLEGARMIPITIGESEAISIALRRARRRFGRPLTHDLLEDMVERLGGSVVGVRIETIEDATFLASVTLKRRRSEWTFDARASDAIALALGSRLPIYVADAVVEEAAVSTDELQREPEGLIGVEPLETL